ncbi:hypothetical protein IU479_23065 [Nocardia abscessus]|uniref:hypothetical protein n=1 Tax=Nocardia abscessus TaxID=120957 RepID=UPI0018943DDA|nr:hypothetical protein [Nocardia abscessus]MBF6220985.1 hypothetical protein [Nocardia abscessus]
MPAVEIDAPKVLWACDSQFGSTTDARAVKIASMSDEHTRESLLNIVERSITAEKLVAGLDRMFTARGQAAASAADGQRPGNDFRSPAAILRRQGR